MKIVIDIPDDYYKAIKEIPVEQSTADMLIIRNGAPLPKGHGRLIDADALEYTCNSDECGMLTGCNHCQYNVVTKDELDNAPTIIEADGGNAGCR